MGALVQELFRFNLYKRSQGRIARQTTFAALAIIVALGCWSLSEYYSGSSTAVRFGVPMVLLAAGLWAAFRVVQMPNFADFLIAVEGEMNKVSWPSRGELFRASVVVMVVIFVLAGLLFLFDMVWRFLLGWLLN